MRFARLALIIATLGCTATAVAQTPPDTRRRMYPTQDGFLEVDPRSGAITECKRAQDGYHCERVTESDALLREDAPRAQAPAPAPVPPAAERRPSGPSDEEIDRAIDVMERFLRRFMGIVREGRGERT